MEEAARLRRPLESTSCGIRRIRGPSQQLQIIGSTPFASFDLCRHRCHVPSSLRNTPPRTGGFWLPPTHLPNCFWLVSNC